MLIGMPSEVFERGGFFFPPSPAGIAAVDSVGVV